MDEKISLKQFEKLWRKMIGCKETEMDPIVYGQMIRDFYGDYFDGPFNADDFLTLLLVGLDRFHELVISELNHYREQYDYVFHTLQKYKSRLNLLHRFESLKTYKQRILKLRENLDTIIHIKREREDNKNGSKKEKRSR